MPEGYVHCQQKKVLSCRYIRMWPYTWGKLKQYRTENLKHLSRVEPRMRISESLTWRSGALVGGRLRGRKGKTIGEIPGSRGAPPEADLVCPERQSEAGDALVCVLFCMCASNWLMKQDCVTPPSELCPCFKVTLVSAFQRACRKKGGYLVERGPTENISLQL